MLNLKKCKQLLRIFAIIALVLTVFALTSCDVIAPILDKIGIDISGIVGDKNDDVNNDVNNDQNDEGNNNNNEEKPDDKPDEKPEEKPDDNTPPECEHVWSEGEIISVPTCGTDEKGIVRSTCTKCSETLDTETDARDSHELERTVVTEVQCGVDGLEKDECKHCDFSVEYVIDAPEHSISFMPVPDEEGKYGNVCVNCGYVESYVEVVTYEQFGAVGDGVTDDSDAIRAAHNYANANGLPVYGNPDATYDIGVLESTITVKTETNWMGATLIFDDSQIRWDDSKHRGVNVFTMYPDVGSTYLSVPEGMTLSKGQTNIGMTFDEPCMLKIINSDEKIYIRYGVNANDGADKAEMILVDENGNVDPSTPIQYDYSGITDIIKYSIDKKHISVGNGKIITIAPNPKEQDPDYENNYCYFSRGIMVQRSNATIYGIEHVIEGEDMTIEIDRNGDGTVDFWGDDKSYGVPYAGFFNFKYCYNTTMTDCIVEGHQAYSFWQGTSRNEMGSYDLSATDCINISFINLTQYENKATGETITNRRMYHGVMGGNFCRNVVMDGCYLDRFDFHQGLYNARITNSTLGFGILVIGGGELYIENVYRIGEDAFILLRTDYNSIFDGDVTIKNCIAGPGITCIVTGNWISHYNGLPCQIIRSLTIDGLVVEGVDKISVFKIQNASIPALTSDVNKLFVPRYVMISGVSSGDGSDVTVSISAFNDAFATVPVNPDPFDLWLDEHTFDDGVIIKAPSTTDCTPGIIEYTCTECGEKGYRTVFSDIPHASLEHTSTDGVITYNCTVCDHAFTPEKGYFMDGTDYNGLIGVGNSAHYDTATGSQNPLINEAGEYELLKKNARQNAKMELWIPNTLSDMDVLSSGNNATGFVSFKVNAYTDDYISMQFVDTASNNGTDRWTANGCITDKFFNIAKPDSDGTVKVTGWDDIILKSVTVGDDKFTGWFDVKIVMELSAEDDTITLHYYIDGQYVDSASRELTTLTNGVDSIYILGYNKAKGSGIKLDDVAFGCIYRKCNPVEG